MEGQQLISTSSVDSRSGRADATMSLHPASPYRLDFTAWALRRRERNVIDRWDGAYRRALTVGDRVIPVCVSQPHGAESPTLSVELQGDQAYGSGDIAAVTDQVGRVLGVDVDLSGFYDVANADPRTRRLADRFLGIHPPRFPGLFETAANAIANQQISLEVGLTLLNRLTAEIGVPAPAPDQGIAFPPPEAVLEADPDRLRGLGFSTRKVEYLRSVADAVTTGLLVEEELEQLDRREATERLVRIRGIGRWSAEYILLRGLGRLDVFPGDDVGARNKLRGFLGLDHDPDYAEISARLEPWQPYAGLLYFHLLLDGLAERGALEGAPDHEHRAVG